MTIQRAKIVHELRAGPVRLVATSDGRPISLRFQAFYDGALRADLGEEAAKLLCTFVQDTLDQQRPASSEEPPPKPTEPNAAPGINKARLMAGR